MKDKIKKILTIIFIVFAVLFGFSWVKSCNNAENIKTYSNVAQTRQNAPKRANEQLEDNKDYIIFESDIIDKVELENDTYYSSDNKVIVELWRYSHDIDTDLKIYFKKGYTYLKTIDLLDNFYEDTIGSQQSAFNWTEYEVFYNYSILHHFTYDYDDSDIAQITTITFEPELIRHNFDYLTNRSIILNSSLSSQFGDNLINVTNLSFNNNGGGFSFNFEQGQTYTFKLHNGTGSDYISLAIRDSSLNTIQQITDRINWNDSITFTCNVSNGAYLYIYANNISNCDIMLNKNSLALPYTRYIDISNNHDKVQLLNNNSNLNYMAFGNYFFSTEFKPLINRYDNMPLIELRNNSLAIAIGTGTQTTLQKIYDYNNNLYLNAYGLVPRTLNFTYQFNHNNLECAILDNYNNGESSYEYEIDLTEYLLNNSQPFTTEQIDTYNIGYQIGKSDGIYQATEWTNIINVLASSIDNILNIQILPNITIKILILVPLMFAILSFIVKTFIR